MNGNRGAKGSVNDRIISYLFKIRYQEYLKKKESYTKEEREKSLQYLKKLQTYCIENNHDVLDIEDKRILEDAFKTFSIEDINLQNNNKKTNLEDINKKASEYEELPVITPEELTTLMTMGESLMDFDVQNDLYDFGNYDFEDAIVKTTSIGDIEEEEIIDVELEIEKKTDEVVIFDELNKFINDSQELLSEMKTEINIIKNSIDSQYTQEDILKTKERYKKLKEKIDLLKKQYDVIKEKYEFEGYEELDNITLIETVEDYKDKASLDELEAMVDACKEEISSIDEIVEDEEKTVATGIELEKKEKQIKKRDHDFINTSNSVKGIEITEMNIREEAINQQQILIELEKKIQQVESEVVHTTEYVYHFGRMFSSFLRITTGILTAPFSNINFFGVMLGTHLVNRGLRDLRANLIPDEVQRTEVRQRYQDVEREIVHAKDEIEMTFNLVNDSLEQINLLKEEFKQKFEPYALYIPEYQSVRYMIEEMDIKLRKQKEKIVQMQATVDNQYKENKQKVLSTRDANSRAA